MNKSFHNSAGATGAQLDLFQERAATQEARVLEFFTTHGSYAFTPFEVYNALFYGSTTPITSVRRAITNLTREGKLVKTTDYQKGAYGMRNHKWQYIPQVSHI